MDCDDPIAKNDSVNREFLKALLDHYLTQFN